MTPENVVEALLLPVVSVAPAPLEFVTVPAPPLLASEPMV
jgi:hypothetical protein